MLYIDIHPQVFIISRECVETVGAGGDDFLDIVCLDPLDVRGGHRLVEIFVPQLPWRLAAAFLLFAEDADTDSRGIADPDEVPGNFTVPFIKRSVTADEVEDVHVTVLLHDLHLEPICPFPPDSIRKTKGIAVHLYIVDGGAHLVTGEGPLHEGKVPAHLKDLVHVLDICRADMLTCVAGGAGPQDVLADGFDQACLGLRKATSPICFTIFMGDSGLSVA